jgi:hypothetical protein
LKIEKGRLRVLRGILELKIEKAMRRRTRRWAFFNFQFLIFNL